MCILGFAGWGRLFFLIPLYISAASSECRKSFHLQLHLRRHYFRTMIFAYPINVKNFCLYCTTTPDSMRQLEGGMNFWISHWMVIAILTRILARNLQNGQNFTNMTNVSNRVGNPSSKVLSNRTTAKQLSNHCRKIMINSTTYANHGWINSSNNIFLMQIWRQRKHSQNLYRQI